MRKIFLVSNVRERPIEPITKSGKRDKEKGMLIRQGDEIKFVGVRFEAR